MNVLDPYHAHDGVIHRLDPRVKLVLAGAFILTTSLLPSGAWPIYMLMLAIAISATLLSEVGLAMVLKRASLAIPFALAALPLVFTLQGAPLFTVGVGDARLVVTWPGLERFASICLKSYMSVIVAIILATTTRFSDLLLAMRALRAPRLLVAVLGLMWRYLFVLTEESQRLLRARASRSGAPSTSGQASKAGGTLAWRARIAGGMAGSLFVRAFERAERVHAAMIARGYDGEVRAPALPPLTSSQRLALIAGLTLFAMLLLLSLAFV